MRYIITILLLFCLNAEGQVIRANAYYRPFAPSLLLDIYPNAAAAYSLRKLRTAYTGAAIRVRKDTTGQPEQDISFDSNGNLDTFALKSFINARNAYVTVWYDQSSNGRNASQSTQANQPSIALAGAINRENGNVFLFHDAVNDNLISTFTISQPFHTFVASNAPTAANSGLLRTIFSARNSTSTDAGAQIDVNNSTTQKTLLYSGAILGDNTVRTGRSIISALSNGSNSALHYNSASIASGNAGASNIGALHFGVNWNFTRYYNNRYYEIVIYNSSQSSNRTGIESNINSFYGIY